VLRGGRQNGRGVVIGSGAVQPTRLRPSPLTTCGEAPPLRTPFLHSTRFTIVESDRGDRFVFHASVVLLLETLIAFAGYRMPRSTPPILGMR
jgi:hypothetical protein